MFVIKLKLILLTQFPSSRFEIERKPVNEMKNMARHWDAERKVAVKQPWTGPGNFQLSDYRSNEGTVSLATSQMTMDIIAPIGIWFVRHLQSCVMWAYGNQFIGTEFNTKLFIKRQFRGNFRIKYFLL